ncbi:hypothetical protein [Microbulbifer epialgicus]|uniref:Uncharacterized protein n=1 Tax=Microbulbifer epialgicus TaxID=393907 RepID=A0ABV4NUT4_9GAMM
MPAKAKSGGSVYRVRQRHLGQLKLYSELECLTKIERKFLLGLIELCSTREDTMDPETSAIDVTRTELQEWLSEKSIGSGNTIIKKRSNALTEIGLFKKEKFQRPKCKPADLFILTDASEVIDAPTQVKQFKDHRPHRLKLKEIKTQLIEADSQILDTSQIRLARSERLWNGVFGSCMRSSRTDPRRNQHFSTIYRFGSDQIEIVTSSQTDSEICHVDDQRTIRAIITMVCLQISERMDLSKEIKNEFYIDIVDLCRIMGLDGSGANRDTVRDSMKRLYSTNFNVLIDSDSETGHKFAAQFGITPGADDLNFRFLTELDSSIDREYGGGSIRRPRWYRIALHSKTFQDIADVNVISTFIDNKDILTVSSGLIHIFYTWCCIHVKRHGNRSVNITLPDLQRYMIPSARYDNFRDRFLMALKNHQEKSNEPWNNDGFNIIKLFGYVVKMEPDMANEFIFNAYRDKSDPIIGDKSIHNRLLKSNKRQGQLELD